MYLRELEKVLTFPLDNLTNTSSEKSSSPQNHKSCHISENALTIKLHLLFLNFVSVISM